MWIWVFVAIGVLIAIGGIMVNSSETKNAPIGTVRVKKMRKMEANQEINKRLANGWEIVNQDHGPTGILIITFKRVRET